MKQQPSSSKSAKPATKPRSGRASFAQRLGANTRLQAIVLAVFAVLLSIQTVSYDFALDDIIVLTDNRFVQEGPAAIPKILTTSSFEGSIQASKVKNTLSGGRYRPLSLVMFAVEWKLFGGKPAGMHVVNVLCNAALVLVLFFTLRLMLELHEWNNKRVLDSFPLLSLLAAALFAAHPTHTEVVANIKSRDEILCLLFALGALYYFVLYCRTAAMAHLALSAGSFALALFAKETAITFLFVMPLTAWFFAFKRDEGVKWSSVGGATAAALVIAVGFLLIRGQIVGFVDTRTAPNIFDNPFLRATVAERYATPVAVLLRYLVSALYPFVMAYDYSFNAIPLVGWTHWQVILSLVVHAALLGFAIWKLRERHVLAYCAWYYFATISIVSNLAFSIGALMGDRFLFMPSVGTTLATACGLALLANVRTNSREQAQRGLLLAAGAVLLVYSVRTVTRNPVWASNEELHKSNISTYPDGMRSLRLRSSALLENAGKATSLDARNAMIGEAYQYLTRCLWIDSTADPDVFFRIGQYHSLFLQNTDSAVYWYGKACAAAPSVDGYRFYYNLNRGNQFLDIKQLDSAEAYYVKAGKENLQMEMVYLNLGVVRINQQRFREAIEYCTKAAAINPQFENVQRALAVARQGLAQQMVQQEALQKNKQ
jgi:hypothetical protein